jgi:hypothetical protein
MNLTVPTSNSVQYRDQDGHFDSELLLELESELTRELSNGKHYRHKRFSGHGRRKAPSAVHPGCGFAGRRHHRWTW